MKRSAGDDEPRKLAAVAPALQARVLNGSGGAQASAEKRLMAEKPPSNGSGLPSPPRKKVADPLASLYGDLPPPSSTTVVLPGGSQMGELAGKAKPNPSLVIFLDVDGVLRPAAPGGSSTVFVDGEAVVAGAGDDFLPGALRALKWLAYQTGARIVLSTEWRRKEPLVEAVNNALRDLGLPVCRPDDVTPQHGPLKMGQEHKDLIRDFAVRRVHEIAEWLNGHKEVTHWCAIDDIDLRLCKSVSKDAAVAEDVRSWLVLTEGEMGFTMQNAERGNKILTGPPLRRA